MNGSVLREANWGKNGDLIGTFILKEREKMVFFLTSYGIGWIGTMKILFVYFFLVSG